MRRSAFAESAEDGAESAADGAEGIFPRLMERLGHFNVRYRVHIMVVAGLCAVGSLIGWWNLRVDTDFVSLFPRDSIVRQRIADLHQALQASARGGTAHSASAHRVAMVTAVGPHSR